MYERLGDVLETLCRTGRDEAILVAPFIKRGALVRLLDALPSAVRLVCYTRWRPEEIAAGVSDPDIWLDLQKRNGATLYLCPSLHAKYYRVDQLSLIGSANLTDTALGLNVTPNLEILTPFKGDATEWQGFERQLATLSVPCHEIIYQQVKALVVSLTTDVKHPARNVAIDFPIVAESKAGYIVPTDLSAWIPQSRQPADLFLAYSNQYHQLTRNALPVLNSDLDALQIPPGLNEPLFTLYVAMQMQQFPCVAAVDTFVSQSQRFGAVRDFLASLPCGRLPDFNPTNSWQTLMRWLLHFLPDRYEYSKPRHSEIFRVRV